METKKSIFDEFTNLYSLRKTLRFELIPQGRTLEYINKKGLISKDEQLAQSYQRMKKTIDGFHKYFIDLALSKTKLTRLKEFEELYSADAEKKKEESFKKEFGKVKEILRKEIVSSFESGEAGKTFSKLTKADLLKGKNKNSDETEDGDGSDENTGNKHTELKGLIEEWMEKQPNKDEIYFDKEFKKFTTYFSGFHTNRKNMYSDEDNSTAIAYRLIHENLPKFIDNIRTFGIIKNKIGLYEDCNKLHNELSKYLNIENIDEVFKLDHYNTVLTQKQIDGYNLIISGISVKEGKKIQGLNEYINLYNQKQTDKKNKVPKIKLLYKQILSDKESVSFLPDNFEDDSNRTASQKVLDAINEYYHSNIITFQQIGASHPENVLIKLKELLQELKEYDLNKIYIKNDSNLTLISNKLFGNRNVFDLALNYYYEFVERPNFNNEYQKAKESKREKLNKDKEKFVKASNVSFLLLQSALNEYVQRLDSSHEIKKKYSDSCITNWFIDYFKTESKDCVEKELIKNVEEKYNAIKGILNIKYPSDKKLYQEKDNISVIKTFLDSLMEFLHFVKPIVLDKDSSLEKDNSFYAQFDLYYEELNKIIPLYNKVRNYATQKSYNVGKIKLNFENGTLAAGWDKNKETDNTTVIFRKDSLYYLGILDVNNKQVFKKQFLKSNGESVFEKMEYKLLPGANKMLPKVFFSKKNLKKFNPTKDLLIKYKNGIHKKGDNFNLDFCHELIDFFKKSISIHNDWKHFNHKFSPTFEYKDISDFYREVEQQGYKITFQNIPEAYISSLVSEGKLYLFQIYNKDFSQNKKAKGTDNLHTLYWKALFDEGNLKNVVYKLNGEAELFYRKRSLNYSEEIMKKGHHSEMLKNKFNYPIISNKRFASDKFQFHVPITLNFKSSGFKNINLSVLNFLKNNPKINIIGIDRGERHSIYITIIDQEGNIKLQKSFNELFYNVKGESQSRKVDYREKLDKREDERKEAREKWGVIESIKELKQGYLSIVVHEIVKLMVKYNAILVMEDLNFGFKRGRFKIEKQVYQKLEKALIDKLNYLVFKDNDAFEFGGIYKALQLTSRFESFKKLGKQSGFLFYVPAWNTSKIDPNTGFVNLFKTTYESIEKAKEFFNSFDAIRFNKTNRYFEFVVEDYTKFNIKAEGTRNNWIICTKGDRIHIFKNKDKKDNWDSKIVNLTDRFKSIFKEQNIPFMDEENLIEEIISKDDISFFKNLLDLFRQTLQMRNSIPHKEMDYLVSPIADRNGKFYDSREATDEEPKNADANGAYNIARKGIILLNKIKDLENLKKPNLTISEKEWLKFAQKIG